MSGQENIHASHSASIITASSSISTNGTPSGVISSSSWLKDILADPIRAAQAGISNRQDNLLGASPYIDVSSLPQGLPFPSIYSNHLLYGARIPTLSNLADHAPVVTPYLHQQAPFLPNISPETQVKHSKHDKDAAAQPRYSASSTATVEMPSKRLKPDESTITNDQPTESSIPHKPDYFHKGSIIQLADNRLKRIEDLQTEDFEISSRISNDLCLDCSTIANIKEDLQRGTAYLTFHVGEKKSEQVVANVEATLEHPFFVYGLGWSSVSPERTLNYYKLECRKLKVLDRCVSLAFKDSPVSEQPLSKPTSQK